MKKLIHFSANLPLLTQCLNRAIFPMKRYVLVSSTGHSASVKDFCIFDNAGTELDLLIHESLLILRDRPTLNQQNSSIPLCLF